MFRTGCLEKTVSRAGHLEKLCPEQGVCKICIWNRAFVKNWVRKRASGKKLCPEKGKSKKTVSRTFFIINYLYCTLFVFTSAVFKVCSVHAHAP